MSVDIFREYDIRGIFQEELNENIVKKIGYFYAKKVLQNNAEETTISVGYDARLHSETLFDWIVSGINFAGLKVINLGLIPTPVSYFSTYHHFDDVNIKSSIMITGSHNPPQYNGFKLTINQKPFFGEMIYSLGEELLNSNIEIPTNNNSLKLNIKDRYIDFIVEHFKHLDTKDKVFAFDGGNGVAGTVLDEILDRLNIQKRTLFMNPDGNFPNHHPDPSVEKNLETLTSCMKSEDIDFGFAYDGDADRVAFLSQKYNFKGDILAIFLSRFIDNPTVIGEVKCSQIMYDIVNTYGKSVMYKTGHSNLKVKIKELDASFAAEVSGHIFFNDRYYGYDDAIYSTFRILELYCNGFDFDKEFEALPTVFTTPEGKVNVDDKKKFDIIDNMAKELNSVNSEFPKIKDIVTIDGLRVIFEDGWGLVRASNTTPTLVTRFEADSKENLELYENALTNLLNQIKE